MRLVVRNRWTTAGASLGFRVALAVIEPSSFVMERGMLLGIKHRVRQLSGALGTGRDRSRPYAFNGIALWAVRRGRTCPALAVGQSARPLP